MGWSDDIEDVLRTTATNVEILKKVIEFKFGEKIDIILNESIKKGEKDKNGESKGTIRSKQREE